MVDEGFRGDIAFRAIIQGRVQGVSFRYHTRKTALELGVRGWVRNLPDGTVEVWAEGRPDLVGALREWLAEGPPAARVDEIKLTEGEPNERRGGFEVRY